MARAECWIDFRAPLWCSTLLEAMTGRLYKLWPELELDCCDTVHIKACDLGDFSDGELCFVQQHSSMNLAGQAAPYPVSVPFGGLQLDGVFVQSAFVGISHSGGLLGLGLLEVVIHQMQGTGKEVPCCRGGVDRLSESLPLFSARALLGLAPSFGFLTRGIIAGEIIAGGMITGGDFIKGQAMGLGHTFGCLQSIFALSLVGALGGDLQKVAESIAL